MSAKFGTEACGAGDLGKISVVGDDVGACPSCKAMLSVGEVPHPHTGRMAKVLLHPIPFCAYFGITEPDVVIKALAKPA